MSVVPNSNHRTLSALCLSLLLAPSAAAALDWQDLWLNDDQRAADKMAREEYSAAAKTFDDERWQAAAWYRAGEYDKAADAWSKLDDIEARYNHGNALARAGRLQEAAAAYEDVLERAPDHADARHNLEVIRERMQQSSTQSDQQNEQEQDPNHRQNRDQQRSEQQDQGDGQSQQEQSNRQDPSAEEQQQQPRSDSEESERLQSQSQQQRSGREVRSERQPESSAGDQHRSQHVGERREETDQPEQRAATEQWLRRIPDDPGGLLRRKFRYQYGQRRRGEEPVGQPW